MPIWGTGSLRTDGRTNPQINTTILNISSPNLISNLSFWFDANDNTTIQLQQGNSSNITGWTSKGNFPIQISTIAQVAPLIPNNAVLPYRVPNSQNGRQTIFMNGVSSMLQFTSSIGNSAVVINNETTIFTVANPTNAISNAFLFAYDFSYFNRISYQINFPGAGVSFLYGNGSPTALVGGLGRTFYGLGYYQNTLYKRNSDTSLAIKFRGSMLNSITSATVMNTNSHFGIGGMAGTGSPTTFNSPFPYFNTLPRFFTGNIAEILWYNRGLTDDEIVSVEGYLAKKWGIQNQLQFNHVGVARNPPLMGYRFLPYTQVVSNYGLWYDAMDTSTIRDLGGNFPPLLPPNQRGIGQWNDKSGNNRHLSNLITQPAQFNLMSPGTFYPVVFATGGASRLRLQTTPASFTGISISAFFVLSLPTTSYIPPFNYTSSFDAMPIPINPNGPNPSTFDFSLRYLSNTIGFSRHGGVFNNNTEINVISAPFSTNTTTLVSIFVNGSQTTIGNVLPSTNVIEINGAFVSSSTRYAGNPFNFQYISMFSGYNFSFQVPSFFNEVGMFYRTLTTAERVAYQSQLIRKWGLQSNAPITYINSLPVSSGLFGWYDAYDQTTVLRNSSNNVSMWLDKSGLSNHMSTNLLTFGSNTGSNIYYSSISISTNQYPSLFFPSTFAFMQTSSLITNQNLSSMTMIAVKRGIKIPNGPQPRTVSLFSTLDGLELGGGFIGAAFDSIQNNTVNNTQFATNYTTFHINTLLGNIGPLAENGVASRNAVTYYNGLNTQTTTGLPFSGNLYPSYIRLMNGAFNNQDNGDSRADAGFLGEVLLYNRILNSNELLNTHTYLLNKWGISTIISNVPVTSGLNLWLDCYDPSAITTDTNCNVLLWRDKSLFRRNFSNFNNNIGAPTYVTQGGNSLPSVRFDNTFNTNAGQGLINSNFFISSISSISIFMVKQVITSATTSFPQSFSMHSTIGYSNGNNEFFIFEDPNGNATTLRRANQNYFNSVNIRNLSLASYTINSSNVALNDIPASNYGLVFNGVKVGAPVDGLTPSTFNTTIGLLGTNATNAFNNNTAYNGFINEVLYYNRALTFVERQQVESYLLSKWNI